VAFEATISPAVLHIWAQYVTDPLISEDALDVLEALADFPECIHPLFLRVVPSLAAVLVAPDQQPPGLVEGALDLLTMLLQVRVSGFGNLVFQGFRLTVLPVSFRGTWCKFRRIGDAKSNPSPAQSLSLSSSF
jgi:hypothetical protein